jgi:hypothetical protein
MSGLRFVLRPESFCIYRLPPDRRFDTNRFGAASWFSVTRTDDELSVVAPAGFAAGEGDCQTGWSCLQIVGTLDLSMVGIIAGISKVLADADISIFTISTYNTDYIFVRTASVEAAVSALAAAGHVVTT